MTGGFEVARLGARFELRIAMLMTLRRGDVRLRLL
jgi:hypothetical protein